MVGTSSSPPLASINFLRSESMNSKTSVSFFSVCKTSHNLHKIAVRIIISSYRTMLGCLSSLSKAISLIAVQGTPYAAFTDWK